MKVLIATTSPPKVQAAKEGFAKMFPQIIFEFVTESIPSGISAQPMTDQETFQGAYNRAHSASEQFPDADFWVGIEGGIDDHGGEMAAFGWAVIKSKGGVIGKAKTATFYLPESIAQLIRSGQEMGHAVDQVFGTTNAKHHSGAIGLLTGDIIDRAHYGVDSVIMALIPFRNESLFKPK